MCKNTETHVNKHNCQKGYDYRYVYRQDTIEQEPPWLLANYVLQEGLRRVFVALPNTIRAIPGHMNFAVFRGSFYGRAKLFLNHSSKKDALLCRMVGRGSTARSFRKNGDDLFQYTEWVRQNTIQYIDDSGAVIEGFRK